MSKNSNRMQQRTQNGAIEVKSKLDAEFRRFTLFPNQTSTFDDFYTLLETLHRLQSISFTIWYTDYEGDLLPINNNDNYSCAVKSTKRIIRLSLLKSGQFFETTTLHKRGLSSGLISGNVIASSLGLTGTKYRRQNPNQPQIGFPEDFRRVSAIIDIDIVPETCRRVKLMKSGGSDKPLGFYIRDGASIRVTVDGLEKVPGVFISRLVPGGLAESTGLLAVNDEILEVNGIEVQGKTLDQVTDMMVANSSNLIITVKPVNQHNNVSPHRRGNSGVSMATGIQSSVVVEEDDDDGGGSFDGNLANSNSGSLDGGKYENYNGRHAMDGDNDSGGGFFQNNNNNNNNHPSASLISEPKWSRSGSSKNSGDPRVLAKVLPSGVQVLEL